MHPGYGPTDPPRSTVLVVVIALAVVVACGAGWIARDTLAGRAKATAPAPAARPAP